MVNNKELELIINEKELENLGFKKEKREMRIENLEVGKVIKNYKELCGLLGIKVTSGKSKKLQLEDLERYCVYHKEGNKFVVDEIYENPLPKLDGRINGNNNVYVEEIGDILVEYISNNKRADNKVLLSFSKIINVLGLVNNTYTVANNKKSELADILNIELSAIHYFYNTSRCEFKKIIKRALNNLQKRSVIKYEEKWQICEKVNTDGETKDIYRLATKDEVSMILDAQKRSLDEMGLKDLTALFLAGSVKYRKFNKKVNEKLPRSWNYYYGVYEIIFGSAAVDIEMKYIEEKRISLNNKSKDKMNKVFSIDDEEESNEKKLTEVLIDLIKYDLKLDEKIIEKYKENKKEKNKLMTEKFNEIAIITREKNKLAMREDDITKEMRYIENTFDNRDSIELYDYFAYKESIDIRKKTNEFINDLELDELFEF
ncbi:hypothetical protein QTI99_06330 [Clostridium perfringens]|uniref:hypothetical protein n=1 Tax=Clostridium perfringens TaxID=1502 RepID=UPI00290CEF70|nr:hypothetical protein [Clostridium perfringens]EIW6613677.1 hypothetical protein [Clostridium perfringens]EJT6170738.1 hypothetical protein [Clostridium perfringens]EJT6541463.1 hypothetical protein [Clostridium perfringens]EJT6566470.1 hypothetical protein [Clostridium perfringens]MBS5994795.1 hypothetical protein [Clostridium perfringens]